MSYYQEDELAFCMIAKHVRGIIANKHFPGKRKHLRRSGFFSVDNFHCMHDLSNHSCTEFTGKSGEKDMPCNSNTPNSK